MSRVFNAANVAPNEQTIITPSSAAYNNLTALTLAAWVFSTNNAINSAILVKAPLGSYDPL